MKKIFISFLISFFTVTSFSQNIFQEKIEGLGDYYPPCMTKSYDGFGIGGTNYNNFILFKIDTTGNVIWGSTYGGQSSYCSGIISCNDSGFVLVGSSYFSDGFGSADGYVVKTDRNGNVIWSKLFGKLLEDNCSGIIQTTDNGYLIIGTTKDSTCGFIDQTFILKTDPAGNIVWDKITAINDSLLLQNAVQTPDGGFFILAMNTGTSLYLNPIVFKMDAIGNILWCKQFEITNFTYPHSICSGINGSYTIVGTASAGPIDKPFLLNIDSAGNVNWCKEYNTYYNNGSAASIIGLQNGGYIFATGADSASGCSNLIKTDSAGNIVSEKKYSSPDGNGPVGIQDCSDRGFLIIGETYMPSTGSIDGYLIKTDSLLNSCNVSPTSHSVISLSVTVTLRTISPISGMNAMSPSTISNFSIPFTSFICPATNVSEINEFDSFLIYPNPATDLINIETDLKNYSVSVFDNMGKLILKEKSYQNKIQINLSGFSNGLYYIQLQSADKMISRKFIKQ